MSSSNATISIFEASNVCKQLFKAKLIPFLIGKPGCGKTSVFRALAVEYNLAMIDIRLGNEDPTGVNGFPTKVTVNGVERSTYASPLVFPLDVDPLPLDENGKEMNGWLIIFDEFNGGDPATQRAFYKVLLEKEIGQHKLHPQVFMCAAGNGVDDGAFVEEIASPVKSRVSTLNVLTDNKRWLEEIAIKRGFDPSIVTFLNFKPDALNNFNPSKADDAYACERSWAAVDQIIKANPNNAIQELFIAIQATIGGIAYEYISFANQEDIPTINEILMNPLGVSIPYSRSAQWATMGMVAKQVKEDNFEQLMKFIDRVDIDLQIVCIKSAVSLNRAWIGKHPSIHEWQKKNAAISF